MPQETEDGSALIARARDWLAEDPDPDTRKELAGLIAEGATEALAERFAGTLQFGTAGLRGEMGAGPARMNRAVVIRAAAGLTAYLARRSPAWSSSATTPGTRAPPSPATPPPWSRAPGCAPRCCRARCPRPCWPSRSGTSARSPE